MGCRARRLRREHLSIRSRVGSPAWLPAPFGVDRVREVAVGVVHRGRLGRGSSRCGGPGRAGRVLRRGRLPEGIAGMTGFGELVGRFVTDDMPSRRMCWCVIETDRGPWVQGVDRRRLPGLRRRPETGRAASGDPRQLRRQERQERCARPGRHGPHPPAPAAAGRRGFRHRGSGQGRRPRASDVDLGTDPAHAAAAGGAAGVLPRRVGGVRGRSS